MTTETWVTAIVSILGALGVREIIPGIGRWLTGGADREKSRIQQLVRERQDAERERDEAKDDVEQEAKRRRLAQEHASSLRRLLIEAGVDPATIPPWPT